jgi:hypothetical protein
MVVTRRAPLTLVLVVARGIVPGIVPLGRGIAPMAVVWRHRTLVALRGQHTRGYVRRRVGAKSTPTRSRHRLGAWAGAAEYPRCGRSWGGLASPMRMGRVSETGGVGRRVVGDKLRFALLRNVLQGPLRMV